MLIAPGTIPTNFTLEGSYRNELLNKPVKWNMPGISEFTFVRTYARKKANGKIENWNECVTRVIEGMFSVLKTYARINHITWDEKRGQRLAKEAADRMFCFKWLPPGRGLANMGADFIWRKGSAALNNCAFVSTKAMGESEADTVAPFRFLMDMSMLGLGVGFDTLGANKVAVIGYSDEVETFVVDDTREGWVDCMSITLSNGIHGRSRIIPDVSKVRGLGEPINGLGGIASGPEPLIMLCKAIEDLIERRKGNTLSSVDITDIQNLNGKCVVSGNVRRTAEIGFSTEDDIDFANMKDWMEFPVETGNSAPLELKEISVEEFEDYNKNIYNMSNGICKKIAEKYKDERWSYKFGGWRWASNNSLMAHVGMDYKAKENSIKVSGEPGFLWLDLARRFGRIKDPENNKDSRADGSNPCVEQTLESFEVCTLVENFPVHCDDYWDYQRTLKFSYLYAKTVTLMGTHNPKTNSIIIRNRRIGCSLSGVTDSIGKVGRTNFMSKYADEGYNYICYIDKKYSEWLGVPQSVKKTSNKPSGTVSLVAGVNGPGVHFAKIRSGFRLIRLAADSALVKILEDANYKVEPAVSNPRTTSVAYFPIITPESIVVEDDTGIWEKVKMAADMQYFWADNQVSCTVEFTQDEADRGEIARVLEAFDGQLKGISFLPKAEGNYAQMPYTRAPREEVQAYLDQLLPLDFSSLTESGENLDATRFCDNGSCEIAA
jgi:hypothetical protein